jgi:hypothetical protein
MPEASPTRQVACSAGSACNDRAAEDSLLARPRKAPAGRTIRSAESCGGTMPPWLFTPDVMHSAPMVESRARSLRKNTSPNTNTPLSLALAVRQIERDINARNLVHGGTHVGDDKRNAGEGRLAVQRESVRAARLRPTAPADHSIDNSSRQVQRLGDVGPQHGQSRCYRLTLWLDMWRLSGFVEARDTGFAADTSG